MRGRECGEVARPLFSRARERENGRKKNTNSSVMILRNVFRGVGCGGVTAAAATTAAGVDENASTNVCIVASAYVFAHKKWTARGLFTIVWKLKERKGR